MSDDFSNKAVELGETICQEADRLVNEDRSNQYGHPKENFEVIAKLWSIILQKPITSHQVALCMILLKVSREAYKHKRDNLTDICGFAKIAEMVQ